MALKSGPHWNLAGNSAAILAAHGHDFQQSTPTNNNGTIVPEEDDFSDCRGAILDNHVFHRFNVGDPNDRPIQIGGCSEIGIANGVDKAPYFHRIPAPVDK